MENKLPYKKNKEWYAVEFSFNNPTTLPFTLDIFNGYNQTPFQTYPNPIVPPSSITGTTLLPFVLGGGCFNPITNALYIGNGSTISILDCSTNLIINTITGVINGAAFGVYNPSNNTMYFGSAGSGVVTVIDCNTNTVLTVISVLPDFTFELCYSSISNKVYVAYNGTVNQVTVIDCSTNTVSSNINIGFNATFLTYNSNSNSIYVSGGSLGDNIQIISCSTDTIINSVTTGSFNGGLVYNPLNNNIYVSCDYGGASELIKVIDCVSNSIISTISTGSSLVGLELSYNALSNLVYVSNLLAGTITVIDCYSNTISATLTGFTQPQVSVFVSKLNTLYVFDSGANSVYTLASPIPFVTYISGTTNYNQFVTELNNIPKRARHIRLIVESSNQLAVPLNILKRDANGNFCNVPKIPTEYRNANNYQGSICDMPFEPKELILNNQMIISQYIIAPNSTVKMVLYFDEIDMSDLLSEKLNVYNQIETKVEDLNTISEATLERRYENRPTIKPSWLKNFKSGKVIKI